jgi:effector-binding domain-containing protein
MKNYKNEIVCVYHKQPISKIDKVSKKLLCNQCEL